MNSPLKERPLRLPGQSSDERLDDLFDGETEYLVYITLFTSLIVYEWIRYIWLIPPQPVPMTIIGVSAIIFYAFRVKKDNIKIEKLRLGRDGERIVGQYLEELRADGCSIFHDILGKGFNIDHVIISPKGIFTVETKTWSKRDKAEEVRFHSGALIVNGHSPDKKPIAQCKAQASWLSNMIKQNTKKELFVRPMLVFPGWYVDQESTRLAKEEGVLLLNPKVLAAFIKNMPNVLSENDITMIKSYLTLYIQMTLSN